MLYIEDDDNTLTCYPSCLLTVPTVQYTGYPTATDAPSCDIDKSLCAVVAATNVGIKSGYEDWSCNSFGYPVTDPCKATAPWPGVTCTGSEPTSICLDGIGLVGKFVLVAAI